MTHEVLGAAERSSLPGGSVSEGIGSKKIDCCIFVVGLPTAMRLEKIDRGKKMPLGVLLDLQCLDNTTLLNTSF